MSGLTFLIGCLLVVVLLSIGNPNDPAANSRREIKRLDRLAAKKGIK